MGTFNAPEARRTECAEMMRHLKTKGYLTQSAVILPRSVRNVKKYNKYFKLFADAKKINESYFPVAVNCICQIELLSLSPKFPEGHSEIHENSVKHCDKDLHCQCTGLILLQTSIAQYLDRKG